MISNYSYRTLVATFFAVTGIIITLSACSAHSKASGIARTVINPSAVIVAEVNGRQITQQEIDDQIGPSIYALEDRAYQLRKSALDKFIADMLIKEEAKKSGVSVDEIKQRYGATPAEVSDEQVNRIYTAQSARFANVSEEEAKRQIKAALTTRAQNSWYEKYLAQLRSNGQVSIFLQPPLAPPIVNVNTDGPSEGAPNAPVVLVEFSDFQCPACKQASGVVRQLASEYADKLKIVYKHMPLTIHKQAFEAAQAAVCADKQGKFWEMHDLLFASTDLSEPALKSYAAKLGLDTNKFNQCLASEESRAVVQNNLQEGQADGISGTPSFILNGRIIRGGRRLEDFKSLIDQEFQRVDRAN